MRGDNVGRIYERSDFTRGRNGRGARYRDHLDSFGAVGADFKISLHGRRVGVGRTASGSNWIGLRSNGAYRVTALEQEKLLPQWLALLIIVGALLLAWRLEGR